MISVGIDIEEISRFKRLLDSKPQLLQRLFTQYEWQYALSKNPSQTLAGIWCAKEATLKAFSFYITLEIRDVHIRHQSTGSPYVYAIYNCIEIENYQISLSISHSKNYATSVCMINNLVNL